MLHSPLTPGLFLSLLLTAACVGTTPNESEPDPMEDPDPFGEDGNEDEDEGATEEDDADEDDGSGEDETTEPDEEDPNYAPPFEWPMSATHYDLELLLLQGEYFDGSISIEEGVEYVIDMTNAEAAETYAIEFWFMSYPAGTDIGSKYVDPATDPLLGSNGATFLTPPLRLYNLNLLPPDADCSGGPETCESEDALLFERAQDEGNPNLELIDIRPSDAGVRFLVEFPEVPSADRDVYLVRTCTSNCTTPSH